MSENSKSELAWNLDDYFAHELEAPERILRNPSACEGELMTDDEVSEYIKDSIATIMILFDHGSDRATLLQQVFMTDLDFLYSLGRLTEDEYNELTNPENYYF